MSSGLGAGVQITNCAASYLLKVEEKSSTLTVLSNVYEMGVGALSQQPSLEGRGCMMSPPHINNSLIMENNLSSNLNGPDFLQQMSPSPLPTTQGQDVVTLLQTDLHLNKYRPRQNNVRPEKEEPASLLWACSIYIARSGQAARHDKTGGTAELKYCTGVTRFWFA